VQHFFIYPPREFFPETMDDKEAELTEFDRQADHILSEMGLDPDGPRTDLTYDDGAELATRLLRAVLDQPALANALARDILQVYREMFPPAPDTDAVESQAYFWGPLVAKWLTGRGLTVPQIAQIGGVTSEHVYRLMRGGLRIIFVEADPPARTGVNRRYSGVDGRATYLVPDPTNLTDREWPGEGEEIRPFIQGLMSGLKSWLGNPAHKEKFEPAFMRAFASTLTDPTVGEVFDGAVVAIRRIAVDLRDKVFTMKAEKEGATKLAWALKEIANHRELALDVFSKTAADLRVRYPVSSEGGGV
jgi:hypothetical protein